MKKLSFKIDNIAKNYISDYFPLENINNNQLELSNGEVIKIFRKKDFFSTSDYNEEELKIIYGYFNNYFKNSKNQEGFSCYIKISKNNKTFEENLKSDEGLQILNDYKNYKLKQIKNKNKKFIDIFFGVSSIYYNNSFKTLMNKLDYEPLTNKELFSFLFDYFNPELATNDLNFRSLPPLTKQQLVGSDYTLLEILYHSYINADNRYFEIGKTKCEVFNLIAPKRSFIFKI